MPSKRHRLPEKTDDRQKVARKQKFVQILPKIPALFLDIAGRYALKTTPSS